MLPALAVSTNPSCRGPIRWAVWVKVAAVLRRGGCTISSDSYLFSNGAAAESSAVDEFP